MGELPSEAVTIIEESEGAWSGHALDEFVRLGLDWADAIEIAKTAKTAESWKRTRDRKKQAKYVDAVVGHDRQGRLLYMAGKELEHGTSKRWLIITIHEAD